MSNNEENLVEKVRRSLRLVVDPELGENVIDLGLIYTIEVSGDGIATIEMTTTTKGCPAAAYLKDAVGSAAWVVPGIHFADVRMTYEPPWSPEMISGDARRRLGIEERNGTA